MQATLVRRAQAGGAMLDGALVLGVALLAGQRAAVQPWAAGGALAAAALLLGRRLGRAWVLVALLVAAVGGWRADRRLRAFDEASARVRDWLGPNARCEARARVVTSPVRQGEAVRFVAELGGLRCEGRAWEGAPVRARLYGDSMDIGRGDELDVVAGLGPVQLFTNADLPDPRPGAARGGALVSGGLVAQEVIARGRGPGAWVDRARAHVRGRIEATYASEAAALGRALVLGEEDLAADDGEAFRRSGLSHLLAVSGSHLVLVVAGLVAAIEAGLRATPLGPRGTAGAWAAAVGVPLAVTYADFAGGSGSAWRAAAMLGALLLARALGRRGDASRALGLSLLVLGVVEPLAAFDLSLQLSAAATAGLIGLSPPLERWLGERLPGSLAGALATTLAATAACAPFLTAVSPELPVAGLAANLLAVPVGEAAALPVCLLHAILPGGAVSRGAALVGSGALLVVRAIARTAGALPGVPLPPLTGVEGAIVAVGVVAIGVSRRRGVTALLTAAALLLGEGLARREGSPRGRLRVTALDVGQGDSLLVDFPDGRSMLVDGGGFVGSPVDPGRSVVLPTLRARRRSRVDVVALSHPHPDHFLGLASALPALTVGELWDSGQGEAEGAGPVYAAMLAGLRQRAVPIRRPDELCGRPRDLGGARVELLAPCPSFTPFANANDGSLVLRLSYGRRAVLLVGDAEAAEEDTLLRTRRDDLRADLLKVGHHGSRTSTSAAFVDAVRPSQAVVSCGTRNRFGHPHPSSLATLAAAGVQVARTDRGGALVWSTDGDRVTTWRGARGPLFTRW